MCVVWWLDKISRVFKSALVLLPSMETDLLTHVLTLYKSNHFTVVSINIKSRNTLASGSTSFGPLEAPVVHCSPTRKLYYQKARSTSSIPVCAPSGAV